MIVVHNYDAHDEHYQKLDHQSEKKQVKLLVISLTDAGSKPRTVMVQLLYANSTDIAMAGPRRTIYVTGHAKLNSIDLQRFRNDIGNLNMALDMLILGDNEQVALHFISLVLS